MAAHPFLDTIAAIILLIPVARLITSALDIHWRITVQVCILFPVYVLLFNNFNPPRVQSSSKRLQRNGSTPRIWSGIVELYMFMLRRSLLREHASFVQTRSSPLVRYVGSSQVGISLARPGEWHFFLNDFCWTQLAVFEEKELVVLYNLSRNSVYNLRLVNEQGEEQFMKICTSYDDSDDVLKEIIENSVEDYTDAVPPNAGAQTSSASASGDKDANPPSVAMADFFRESGLKYVRLTDSGNSHVAHKMGLVSLREDVLPKPRRKFDICTETLCSAQELLDNKKAQCRKLRKDSVKRLANLRTEIDSLQTKLVSKLRSDERARKRIQALKERVAQHRLELAQFEEVEQQSREVEQLANEAQTSEKDLQTKRNGLDLSLRLFAEEENSKRTEVSKHEQRCAKLSDRLERIRSDQFAQKNALPKEIDEYINQIRMERNNRKAQCVRLESNYLEAIRRLDVPRTS